MMSQIKSFFGREGNIRGKENRNLVGLLNAQY